MNFETKKYVTFELQVKLLMRVHHTNLTSLVGYCNEGDNKALIYEFMENGDLESHILGDFLMPYSTSSMTFFSFSFSLCIFVFLLCPMSTLF